MILRISAALKPRSVLIPVPSFPGYERAVAGGFLSSPRELTPEVKYFFLKEEDGFAMKAKEFIDALKGCDLALLCNPHYPTGGMLERQEMVAIARAAEMNGCHLIIDETFLDFVPAESMMNGMNEFSRVMVVKSLGYYYALLGLGAAYSILPGDISSPVLAAVPCPPGDLNQRASVVALKDKVYKKETAHVLGEEKAFLETELRKCDIAYLPSRANFYLLKISDAPQLCDFLLSRHILAGRCDNYRGLDNRFLRISVRNHRENALLVKALREFRTRENSM
jgi:threonine-phosphate decarboxylase